MWPTIPFFLITSILKGWYTQQLDFVLMYTQANMETELYMEVPKGFHVDGDHTKYVLKLIKNLYGQKQARWVWNQHVWTQLHNLGFVQSKVDEGVFYFKCSIFLVFTDDMILLGPSQAELDQLVTLLHSTFKIQDKGTLVDYFGLKVQWTKDMYTLTQLHLIASILQDLHLTQCNLKSRPVPALMTRLLTSDDEGASFDSSFDYRSVIGKLN